MTLSGAFGNVYTFTLRRDVEREPYDIGQNGKKLWRERTTTARRLSKPTRPDIARPERSTLFVRNGISLYAPRARPLNRRRLIEYNEFCNSIVASNWHRQICWRRPGETVIIILHVRWITPDVICARAILEPSPKTPNVDEWRYYVCRIHSARPSVSIPRPDREIYPYVCTQRSCRMCINALFDRYAMNTFDS